MMKLTSLKSAAVGGVVGAFVASGTVALATTSNLILGSTANEPDAPTAVVAKNVDDLGGLNAPMIKLTNSSSGSSATPLALNAGVGRPPLMVNNKTKVPNLNADWLDGLDSGYFLPKTGTAANSSKLGASFRATTCRRTARPPIRTSSTESTSPGSPAARSRMPGQSFSPTRRRRSSTWQAWRP
jgi:hypothetical protein